MSPEPHGRSGAPASNEVVIDGCSFFLRGYGERQERSGVTAIQITAAYPDDSFEQAVRRMSEYFRLVRREDRLAIVTEAEQIPAFHTAGRVGGRPDVSGGGPDWRPIGAGGGAAADGPACAAAHL